MAPSLLILSQGYPPDPVAVGQHLHDAAREMVARGWEVRVVTSRFGWADPGVRYPARETLDGVAVSRLAGGGLGKASLAARAISGSTFLARALVACLRGPRPDHVLVSTCPPMAPAVGALVGRLRRAPVTLWLMDLNPDQALVTGAVRPGSLAARLLDRSNRAAARGSRKVVVLDRFMAARVAGRWVAAEKLCVLPPWPHEDHVSPVDHGANPFRARHGLVGKRVVMYSGNLSPVHPLDTILQAATTLKSASDLVFLFVGAGGQRARIDEVVQRERLDNVRLLPYQPLENLRFSLSAADVHLVSMGNEMVGIVHPCKVYGAMAAARPLLLLGPRQSHIGELVDRFSLGWQVEHGDVDGAVKVLREIADAPEARLTECGARARLALTRELSQARLRGAFCDVVEFNGLPERRESVLTATEGDPRPDAPHPRRGRSLGT